MKKIIASVFFFSLIINVSFAQLAESVSYPKQIVRTNLFADARGRINGGYEYVVSDYSSCIATLNANVTMPMGGILNGFNLNGSDWNLTVNNRPKFFSVGTVIQYRFYSKKKKGPRGFYCAPYVNYSFNRFSVNSDYTGDIYGSYRTANSDLSFSVNSLGGGFLLGAQWLIKNKVTIDWNFFGLGVNRWFGKLSLKSDDLESDMPKLKSDVEDTFGSVFSAFRDNVSVKGNELKVKGGIYMPAYHTSLVIGFAL